MTTTEKQTPAQAFEFHHIHANELLRQAKAEHAEGRHGLAKALRRMARGHKAAATRIGRREGWL